MPVLRVQAGLKQLVAQHAEELKKARRKYKAATAELAALNDEVTDLRFRSHELEAVAAVAGGASGGALSVLGQPAAGAASRLGIGLMARTGARGNTSDVRPQRDVMGQGDGGDGLTPAMMSELAALRERQREFLAAAGSSVQK